MAKFIALFRLKAAKVHRSWINEQLERRPLRKAKRESVRDDSPLRQGYTDDVVEGSLDKPQIVHFLAFQKGWASLMLTMQANEQSQTRVMG